jgi:uncharacterized protein (DUF608 family)
MNQKSAIRHLPAFLFLFPVEKLKRNPVKDIQFNIRKRVPEPVAFPVGGIGAGMICFEGSGAISHVSVRNHPDVFNEPFQMAVLSVKGMENGARVLEGPVPGWKIFGNPMTGNGAGETSYGFPRFGKASFETRFPFGILRLEDEAMPVEVTVTAWSPFIPGDEDNSSLPVGGFEYTFKNTLRKGDGGFVFVSCRKPDANRNSK